MGAAADYLDTVERYNDAAEQVQEWKDRIERAWRDPHTTSAQRDELLAVFKRRVAVAEPLREQLDSRELIGPVAADLQPVELPAEPVEREPVSVQPPRWGERSRGRVAQLERERLDRQAVFAMSELGGRRR